MVDDTRLLQILHRIYPRREPSTGRSISRYIYARSLVDIEMKMFPLSVSLITVSFPEYANLFSWLYESINWHIDALIFQVTIDYCNFLIFDRTFLYSDPTISGCPLSENEWTVTYSSYHDVCICFSRESFKIDSCMISWEFLRRDGWIFRWDLHSKYFLRDAIKSFIERKVEFFSRSSDATLWW